MDREFLAHWKAWYPDSPPLAFALREIYPDLWLRIHSLPQGKRYAETDSEQALQLAERYPLDSRSPHDENHLHAHPARTTGSGSHDANRAWCTGIGGATSS